MGCAGGHADRRARPVRSGRTRRPGRARAQDQAGRRARGATRRGRGHDDRRRGQGAQSPPAQPGDMVVRNRCPESGNEEILVTAAKFAERYEGRSGRPMPPAGSHTGRAASRWPISSCAPPMARSPSPRPGASRWWRARATRSCATRATRRTPIGSPPPRSRAPTRFAAGALSRYCRTMGSARINALFEAWIVARPHEWQCFQNRWPKSTRRQVLQTSRSGCRRPRRAQADGRDAARAASGGVRSIVQWSKSDGWSRAHPPPLLRPFETVGPDIADNLETRAPTPSASSALIVTERGSALRLILGNNA